MSIQNRFTAGRCTIASAVYPVIGFGIAPNVIAEHVNHSGLVNSTQVLVAGTDLQRLTLRTPLQAVASALGLVPTVQDTVAAVFARTRGGLVESGTVHQVYSVASEATVWIDEWSVTEGEAAVATVAIDAYSADGDAEPWDKDAGALPALSAAAVHHGIGPVVINGTAIPQVTGISYRSGLSVAANRVSGLPVPAGGVISGLQQEITIDVSDAQAAWQALGGKGVALSGGGAVINLYRYAPANGILDSTGQMTFTATAGFASMGENQADHGQIGSGSITIRATSDGAASGFVVS